MLKILPATRLHATSLDLFWRDAHMESTSHKIVVIAMTALQVALLCAAGAGLAGGVPIANVGKAQTVSQLFRMATDLGIEEALIDGCFTIRFEETWPLVVRTRKVCLAGLVGLELELEFPDKTVPIADVGPAPAVPGPPIGQLFRMAIDLSVADSLIDACFDEQIARSRLVCLAGLVGVENMNPWFVEHEQLSSSGGPTISAIQRQRSSSNSGREATARISSSIVEAAATAAAASDHMHHGASSRQPTNGIVAKIRMPEIVTIVLPDQTCRHSTFATDNGCAAGGAHN